MFFLNETYSSFAYFFPTTTTNLTKKHTQKKNEREREREEKTPKLQKKMYYDCCEKELRALGKSLECCVCIRLMESPARTRWYALATRLFLMPSLSLSLSL